MSELKCKLEDEQENLGIAPGFPPTPKPEEPTQNEELLDVVADLIEKVEKLETGNKLLHKGMTTQNKRIKELEKRADKQDAREWDAKPEHKQDERQRDRPRARAGRRRSPPRNARDQEDLVRGRR